MVSELSLAEARRLALAAQGFGEPRPRGRVDRRHLRRAMRQMGVVQIDSVNVLVRSQELPLFARLGPHPRTLIPEASEAGELFEYWVHEACHVPTELHPLFRWQMAQRHRWRGINELDGRRPGFIDEVERRVASDGPLAASDLAQRVGKKGSWWDWDDGKVALEYLFWTGRLSARRRPTDFARLYDLTERVIPAEVLAQPTPSESDARKELLVRAAGHLGVATAEDLVDYHRQRMAPCRPLLADLVAEGRLEQVRVEGWDRPAFLRTGERLPRRVDARAMLSPFDPVVWCRPRVERLFGFRYRIEIYVPAPKRQYGYYVLPFLLGDRLVARVDLKADRRRRVLMVQGAFLEPTASMEAVCGPLASELLSMAEWLDLDSVEVIGRGDLASPVAGALRRYAAV